MISKLINKTVEELKFICRQKNITGYSKLNKEDLIKLVKKNSKIKNEKVEKSKKGGGLLNALYKNTKKNIKRSDSDIKEAVHLWINDKKEAIKIYGYIDYWDTSEVTDMSYLFCGDNTTNTRPGNVLMKTHKLKGIENWDVSNVINMSHMFYQAKSFNQPIGNWDVSNVKNMSYMFHEAKTFNQPIGSWDVLKVTNMSNMFSGAESFNQPIFSWDVSQVTDMSYMFYNAKSFNRPINSWNVSNVGNEDNSEGMSFMFHGAELFNQPIGSWDVSNVTNMAYMFFLARTFNQPIGNWNVSNVSDMEYMFYAAKSFNQPINTYTAADGNIFWDVTNVRNMEGMFYNAKAFNQDISNWNVRNVSDHDDIFEECRINHRFKPSFRERNNFLPGHNTYISQNMLKSNNNSQNMLRSNNNTCKISEVYTKLYNHILKVDDTILRNQKFEFEKQEGINAGGLSRTVFDLFYKTYFHKFFKYIDNNNKDLGIILKNTKNNKNMDQFYNATNKLIILAEKGDLKIFMLINKILFDLLKSDDPIQQINLNKKNIYDKDRLLNNNYRKLGYGDNESKISDVIVHHNNNNYSKLNLYFIDIENNNEYNNNNSKWNKNFNDIENNNEKKEVFFRRYLHSLGFESDNHFVRMKQWINNYWLEHPTLFSNEMPSYLKKDFIKRIRLIEQGIEKEKNLKTNILTNNSNNSIINKYPNVKVLLEYILNDDNDEYRKKFCNWATGSIYSYENIKIKLYQMQKEVPFISHTCFNRVDVFQTVKSPYFNNIRALNTQINSDQKSFSVA